MSAGDLSSKVQGELSEYITALPPGLPQTVSIYSNHPIVRCPLFHSQKCPGLEDKLNSHPTYNSLRMLSIKCQAWIETPDLLCVGEMEGRGGSWGGGEGLLKNAGRSPLLSSSNSLKPCSVLGS